MLLISSFFLVSQKSIFERKWMNLIENEWKWHCLWYSFKDTVLLETVFFKVFSLLMSFYLCHMLWLILKYFTANINKWVCHYSLVENRIKHMASCVKEHNIVWNCLWFSIIANGAAAAAAAAKSLQSCPTLCDPIDSSPPGSPVPGILQARTLQWVAISFSKAGKWKVKVKSLSHVQLLATPWTVAHQAPPSMGFSRQEYWSGVPLPSPVIYITIKLKSWIQGGS